QFCPEFSIQLLTDYQNRECGKYFGGDQKRCDGTRYTTRRRFHEWYASGNCREYNGNGRQNACDPEPVSGPHDHSAVQP
ncbi:MAG: hypothetical protein V3R72_03635, partial [Gammaproteobacteria bacterium]